MTDHYVVYPVLHPCKFPQPWTEKSPRNSTTNGFFFSSSSFLFVPDSSNPLKGMEISNLLDL